MAERGLFDTYAYLDPYYRETLEFVRHLGAEIDELPQGVPKSGNFCPVATALNMAFADDWPAEYPDAGERENIGGMSYFFDVSAERVLFPADFSGSGIEEDLFAWFEREGFAADKIIGRDGHTYNFDDSGEFLRRVEPVPPAVKRFILGFDLGEYPSLVHPTYEEV